MFGHLNVQIPDCCRFEELKLAQSDEFDVLGVQIRDLSRFDGWKLVQSNDFDASGLLCPAHGFAFEMLTC